jgi:flagellar hook-length control protein FliK
MNLPAALPCQQPAVDAAPGTPQPEASPDALFAALLNIQTARTAPAEGQTTDTPVAPDAPDATELAELVAALPVAAPLAPPAAPAPAPAQVPAAAVAQAEPAKPAPAVPATPATPAVPAVPAHRAAPDGPASAPPAEHKEPPRAQPATPAVPAKPATAARPEQDPVKAETAVKAPEAKEPSKPIDPAPRQDTPIAPLKERPATAHEAPEPRPVLRGERIEALVRLATRHGVAEARMELHPQELGSVVVKLRVTSDGLQATFTASNPEALSQLQQAGDDLRRSLEAKGLTLATLDVRAEADQAGERRGAHTAGGGGSERGSGRRHDPRPVEELDEEPIATAVSVPAGELVDVQA